MSTRFLNKEVIGGLGRRSFKGVAAARVGGKKVVTTLLRHLAVKGSRGRRQKLEVDVGSRDGF